MTKFADEMCAEVSCIDSLRPLIIEVERALALRGFSVSLWLNGPASATTWGTGQGARIVRVAIRRGASTRTPVWDLLHELGHVLTGPPEPARERRLSREREAWEAGWHFAIETYPKVNEHEREYAGHRDACLKTYNAG